MDLHLGPGVAPSWSDRPRLPYVEAVVQEVLRKSVLVTMPVARVCNAAGGATIAGHAVPRGAHVMANVGMVLTDERYFGDDAGAFRPGRHLGPDGELRQNKYMGVIFGSGSRRCVAETLARMELFLFLTGILARFRLETCEGFVLDEDQPRGFMSIPLPYKIKFVERGQ